MRRQPTRGRTLLRAFLPLALAALVAGCGQDAHREADASATKAVAACQAQW
jgi:hypothetical protein